MNVSNKSYNTEEVNKYELHCKLCDMRQTAHSQYKHIQTNQRTDRCEKVQQ